MDNHTPNRLWEAALGQLQLQVSRANFQTWLKDTAGLRFTDGTLEVGVPTDFALQWLSDKLQPLITRTVSGIVGEPVEVTFHVQGAPASGGSTAPPQSPAPSSPTVALPTARLNDHYTFQRFIVGDGARLAYAAARAAADMPGKAYNPVFLYGGAGLGKTHLLHGIGHRALEPGLNVISASAEKFTNEFVMSIASGSVDSFRRKYRAADVLLIDDIQFIAGKERTQEEFFHTFNDLHSDHKQIVITSDRPPQHIALLEERLRSRFEWGLTADIQPPDMETRLAILHARAQEQGASLPQEIAVYIAERVQDNVRELEGCLNRLQAFASLTLAPLTLELAVRALTGVIGPDLAPKNGGRRPKISPEGIVEAVADYFSLESKVLVGPSRGKSHVYARHIAAYLLKEMTPLKATAVARLLGNRDHSTILHAYSKMQKLATTDPTTRRHLVELHAILER